jgi:transcriptional regulator with XRE-family HTH domain
MPAEDARIAAADPTELGRRIRQLRLERSLIGADLAAQAGISASFLSQLERGLASPSLKVLGGLARALGVPTATLLGGADGDAHRESRATSAQRPAIVRRGERKVLRRSTGPEYELLSPDLTGAIEFVWYRLEPGEESVVEASHEGEEQMLVLAGTVVQAIDGRDYELGPGDSIRFDSALPHRTINRGDEPAEIVSAGSPPSF